MCGMIPTPFSARSNDPVMDALEAELAEIAADPEKFVTASPEARALVIQRPDTAQETRADVFAEQRVDDQDEAVRGLRANKGKLRTDLLPVEPIIELARLLTIGAEKYAERNWEKGMPYKDALSSLERHLLAWKAGEDNDPVDKLGTGLNHMIHVMCNAMFLYVWQARGVGTDDRVKVEARP